MLSDLSLDFAFLVVVLGNDSGETAVCWNYDECCAHLQRVVGHVLDEIPVPGCNDDGVVTLFPEKTLRDANYDHSTLPLLPQTIHVESGCRGICPSAPPSTSTCQVLARKWHPIGVAVVILPLSSCPQMESGKCFFSKLTKTSGTDVVNAGTLDGKT